MLWKINGNGIAERTNKKGHNMQKTRWRSITDPGTKEELLFATHTLGEIGEGWNWMKYGKKFMVGIPKREYDRINKKYARIMHGKKELV